MWDFAEIKSALTDTDVEPLAGPLQRMAQRQWAERMHGDRVKWIDAIAELPPIPVDNVSLNENRVKAISNSAVSPDEMTLLRQCMLQLHPWRKGPFDLFGLFIDTEWRSDLKWERIAPYLSDLTGRVALDIGSGNGYYLYRMLGAGASAAVGVDPTQLFVAQFQAINHYLGSSRALVLPLKGEDLVQVGPDIPITGFDTVFSMGIYYHRRDPMSHLAELAGFLRPGGELVLETLIVEDDTRTELRPENRYARMRNVWSVPSVPLLMDQLAHSGFSDFRLVDVTPTSIEEQRQTQWMTFESLADCLDPTDPTKTIEGYPAPVRACIIATREK